LSDEKNGRDYPGRFSVAAKSEVWLVISRLSAGSRRFRR